MTTLDILGLRDTFEQHRILMCFNGPFSASLIEEIGMALRRHLESVSVSPGSVMDVFAVYIELTQNIRHYAREKSLPDELTRATVVISLTADGRYLVSAGNKLFAADGEQLLARIEALAALDKAALKAAYKEQLRQPRAPDATTGAGLGLIDMARRASEPLSARLQHLENGMAFFSLEVVI
ncbi:biofilm regulation protein kinase SiaB [Chitinilyticum litopenaei]|uniref:biofilm regulation protein kinase SiaB n=1 Tax=Chitinilyticum litopenaei TaxID=1121276 RepID=UPI00041F16D5|nr:biofilm regulation protein kinase SiaB [Chitinilyticum litopenaei]